MTPIMNIQGVRATLMQAFVNRVTPYQSLLFKSMFLLHDQQYYFLHVLAYYVMF